MGGGHPTWRRLLSGATCEGALGVLDVDHGVR